MNRHQQFLQAILDDPDDDALRLVYADWLEEQGDPRAEFIRLQCELEKAEYRRDWENPRRRQLTAWEIELIRTHKEEWFGPVRTRFSYWECHRGFIDEVHCTEDVFFEVADELFAAQPVRHLRLSLQQGRLGKLAASTYLGRLKIVRLWGHPFSRVAIEYPMDEWQRFLSAPQRPRWTELSLLGCGLGQEHTDALVGAPCLEGLQLLDLSHNHFPPESSHLLESRFGKRVRLGEQSSAPRYPVHRPELDEATPG
jgi:uncharacterized protein (TIGR02996 family)